MWVAAPRQTTQEQHPWGWHGCGELICPRAVIQPQGEPRDIWSWLGILLALAFLCCVNCFDIALRSFIIMQSHLIRAPSSKPGEECKSGPP